MEKKKDTKKNYINKQITDQLKDTSKISDIQGLVSMIYEEKVLRYDMNEFKIVDIIRNLIQQSASLNSFLIMDIGILFKQYKLWQSLLPNVEIYYAVKCNPDKILLQTLAYLGVGFDVASKAEISMIDDLEISGDKIIFANPVKAIDHIMCARDLNINIMTFDNEDELKKISVLHPKAQLILRIYVDDSKSRISFSSKFGCPPNNLDNVFTLAKQLEMNLVGVSFHVGSSCLDAAAYANAIIQAREVFKIAEKYGYKFHILDIGGGFPGTEEEQNSEECPITFEKIANEVNSQLEKSFSDVENLRVLAEPGRFFATGCGILVTNIIGKKKIVAGESDEEKQKIFHYFINSNLYGMFNNIVFDHAKPEFHLLNKIKGEKYISTIFGQTCDSLDKICENVNLPELACGDWLYVPNHGAYTSAAASTFNGFSLAETKYIYTYD